LIEPTVERKLVSINSASKRSGKLADSRYAHLLVGGFPLIPLQKEAGNDEFVNLTEADEDVSINSASKRSGKL